ncbi:YadA-like family protein, partial [Bisgaard Taxon 10/6]|uniref:YadA family autotransporter adhesin n=2 Tax=Exercitatus varius TaxID=67857 RepID=UPI00294AF151
GQNGTDAVNVDQLNAVNATANAGWNLTTNGQNSSNVAPNATVDLANTDGNINIAHNGTNVTFDLNSNLTVGGKDGKDGQIGAMGANGTGVVLNGKDGTIGINGTDGTNGTVTLAQGPAGVDGVNGTDRIVYETPNGTSTVATLDDGLIFTGNNEVLNKHKLNSTVNIIGEGVDKDMSANFTGAAGNINVKADGNSTLVVQLAQDLVNLTSATFTNGTTNTVVNGNGVTINGGTNGVVSLTDTGLNNGNNTITNVSAGQNGTDAVNVDQLKEVNATANAGWNLAANGNNVSNVKPNATVSLNNIDGNIVITKSTDDNNVTFGLNSTLNIGSGANTVVIDGTTGKVSTGSVSISKDGLDNGNQTMTNVANGVNATDAVNVSQLNASTAANAWKITGNHDDANAKTVGHQTVSFNNGTNTVAVVSDTNVTFDLADNIKLTKDGSMTIGTTVITNGNIKVGNNVAVTETGFTAGNVSVTTSGINAGGKTITNVARGVADDDAVNVSQLNEVKETANAGWDLTVNGTDGSKVKPKDTVDLANKDGNINITKSGNNVTFDLSDKLNIGSGANTVVIDGTTGKVSAGNVSIGKDGISAGGQTITNVAPGVNGTDAVNVDQLRNFTSSVVEKPLTFAGDTGTPSERKLGSTVTVKGGVSDTAKLTDNNIGVVSDGQGSLNVKLAKDLTGLNSVTISNGSASTKLTTVTKKNVEGKEASALDVGGNQITNVAPGEVSKDSTDAVNGSQLHATNQQVIRNANAINQVAGQVHSVDRKLRAGVAGALASGGLYHATMPGKSMVAAGAGTYRGESAIAVGYSRLSDNGKLGVKFSVNSNTRGDTGAAASVGYQW